MKCPYCQTQMESGFLTDLGFDGYEPRWRAENADPSFWIRRPGKSIQFRSRKILNKLRRLFEIEASYCSKCEKFIFDGKVMEE